MLRAGQSTLHGEEGSRPWVSAARLVPPLSSHPPPPPPPAPHHSPGVSGGVFLLHGVFSTLPPLIGSIPGQTQKCSFDGIQSRGGARRFGFWWHVCSISGWCFSSGRADYITSLRHFIIAIFFKEFWNDIRGLTPVLAWARRDLIVVSVLM